jgi:hypothetical protein
MKRAQRSRDLAPTACITDLSEEDQDSTVVTIPYEKLCSFCQIAETRDNLKTARQGLQSALPPNCKKRRREPTPPETLSPGRNSEFAQHERRQAARVEAEDITWHLHGT